MAISLAQLDLILLDIQLPYEDGYAVLQQMRAHQKLGQTKVVAVTANFMPQDIERVRVAGFDGLIGKPLNPIQFPEQIRSILSGEAVWQAH